MLRNRSTHLCAFVIAGALIGMILLWAVSSIFGLTGEICEKASGAQDGNCPSYNLLFSGIWHLTETANWLSPALTALATIAIGYFTWTLWRSGDRTGEHFRASERAYMLMSHKSGLEIDGQKLRVTMQIRNWGKTPGTVTDNVLGPVFFAGSGKLPPNPDYDLVRTPNPEAFLAPSGKLEWTQEFVIGAPDLSEVIAGRITLIMLGYVDYRDQFGGRHRNGYAREYGEILTPEGNNLGFVRDVRGYNYDRPRTRREGNDWNDA
jgi:hypothetical protein